MAQKISEIRKRDGSIAAFEESKIVTAIYKAARSVGGSDMEEAKRLADIVVKELEHVEGIPTVEHVQDTAEKVLIEAGHAKTAKAYIVYRQKRAELREQKMKVLDKDYLDEVDKRFDLNALRVLKSRYLKKDENGKLIETPKELFTRVAVHSAIPDIFYDDKVYDINAGQNTFKAEDFDAPEHENKFSIGKYKLNQYHIEGIRRVYERHNKDKKIRVSWSQFLELLGKGYFDKYERSIEELYSLMVEKKFMPNTPAIANFGNSLGMGSACFHPDQLILTTNGPKKISEMSVGDDVLTHKGRFRKVKQVFIRESDSLLSFECKKLPKPAMLATDEHPILAFKGNEIGWYPAYMLKEGDKVALSYPNEVKDVEKIFVSEIVTGLTIDNGKCFYEYKGGKFNAFVHTTKPVNNTIEVDYELMKLFGFYLSEGNVSNSDCVRFTLSLDEKEYCNEIISIMEKKFGVTSRIETNSNPKRKWLNLRFHSTIVSRFFENMFGTGYDKKIIPGWVMLLPVDKQKGLMSGMIRGDGTVFKNWNKMNARLAMSNTNLVYAFWQMCMRCGVFASLRKEKMPKLGNTQPVICTLGDAKGQLLMNELFGETIQETMGEDKTLIVNGIAFTDVEKIERADYKGAVYNLEVEEDHSYVANMVSVHNCFVLGIDDSMESIMDTLKYTAIIHKSGGGTGFNFSKIRPEGDFVSSTSGAASGPLSFMRMFDTMTEVVKQGGIRRGANMGILNSNHPDIEKFIAAKSGNQGLRNFNISVLIMGDFWEYYERNEPYPLINPRNGEVVKTVNPRMLFDKIVYQAWESAEPGVIFFDTCNKYNPFLESLGPIVTTNPCVAADTLIPTGNGLERIDSIKSDNIFADARAIENSNSQLVSLQSGVQKVKLLRNIKTGYKETLKLETNSGYELIATPDHKILTENGWKQLSDLDANDKILLQSGAGSFNKDVKLPFEVENKVIGGNGRKYKLNLPTKWSKELGLILGWLTGDGWLNSKFNQVGLVFSEQDNEAKENLKPIFESYCNRQVNELKYKNSCIQIRSGSKHVVDFFSKLGVKSIEKEVPNLIFTATEEAVIGFLQGLFSSDGTIGMGSESRNYVRLNSSSKKLLKQVQILLLNLGIRSSIYDRFTKQKKFTYTNKDGKEIEYKTSGVNYELNISKDNVQRFLSKVGFLQSKHNGKIVELEKFEFYKEYFVDKVKSIENAGKREVWDITEPLTHSFIANGIVVHNCGEVLLYPNEPCNLGSINVWAFAKEDADGNAYYDWSELTDAVLKCVRFLDNVIDINKFPLKQIEEMSLLTRKIGLGVMGLGDLLYELRLPYNSDEGRKFIEKVMQFVAYYSKVESIELAKTRGKLPYFEKSFFKDGKLPFRGFELKDEWDFDWDGISSDMKNHGIRNGYTTVIAPTGSISMIAGCSSGIEPVYSLAFEKNVKVGSFYYVDPAFEKALKKEGLYSDELMEEICENNGSVQGLKNFPSELQKVFVTALNTTPEDHIRALASVQKWVDSSISKTNNFPADATIDNMRESYLLAYKLGCKDVTVFRDSSIKGQVLVAGKRKETAKEETKAEAKQQETPVAEKSNASSGNLKTKITGKAKHKICPECGAKTQIEEGCVSCKACGWALCK